MIFVGADAGFPAPAAFAFFSFGLGHDYLQFLRLPFIQVQLGYIEEFPQIFLVGLANLEFEAGTGKCYACLETLANLFGLPRFLQRQ